MMRAALIVCLVLSASTVAAQQDSTGARDHFTRARTALQQGKTDEAVKLLERAVTLDGRQYEYHMWLGHAYSRQIATVNFLKKATLGRRIGAEYNMAVNLAPQNVDAAEARLEFFLNAPGIAGGGVDKAKTEAARIATLSAYRGHFATAKVAEHEKDLSGAERGYRELLRQYSDSSLPVSTLATFLQNNSRFDEAFTLVEQRLAQVPDDTNNVYQLGRIAAISGQRLTVGENALRKFLGMLGVRDTVNRAQGHYRLGMIKEKQGDTAAARAEYHQAVELYPPHAPAAAALKRLSP